jgi:hypothetical protein
VDFPFGIAVSGNDLFLSNAVAGTVGEYGLDGSTINPALISGLNFPKASPSVLCRSRLQSRSSAWARQHCGRAAAANSQRIFNLC